VNITKNFLAPPCLGEALRRGTLVKINSISDFQCFKCKYKFMLVSSLPITNQILIIEKYKEIPNGQ
jgi:hypothetical protein